MLPSLSHIQHLADLDAPEVACQLSAGRDPSAKIAKLWRRACRDAALDANERVRWEDEYRRVVILLAKRLLRNPPHAAT
jgi:hypothetical protein